MKKSLSDKLKNQGIKLAPNMPRGLMGALYRLQNYGPQPLGEMPMVNLLVVRGLVKANKEYVKLTVLGEAVLYGDKMTYTGF